jgi:hypothetical protein
MVTMILGRQALSPHNNQSPFQSDLVSIGSWLVHDAVASPDDLGVAHQRMTLGANFDGNEEDGS